MIDTWKSTKYRSFLFLGIKIKGNQIYGLAAPTADGDKGQFVKGLIRRDVVAPFAVIRYMKQFDRFSVQFTQKLEFLAKGGRHPELRTGQHSVGPGSVGPFSNRPLQSFPVQVAGENQMDAGDIHWIEPVFHGASGDKVAVI